MVLNLFQSVSAREVVGILTLRQKHDLHVQTLLQHKSHSSKSGLYSRTVTVVDDGHVIRELADQADLLDRKRRAARSDDVLQTELMHRKHIEISLDQDTFVLTGHFVLREPDAVKRTALHIYLRFGRIHIFCDRLVGLEGSSSECDHASADRMDRKDDPVEETVHQTAVLVFYAKAGLGKELLLISCRPRRIGQSPAAYGSPAKTILADGLILETAALEVLVAYGLSLRGLKAVLEELACIFGHEKKALVPLPLGDFLSRLLLLDDFDMVFLCKILQRFGIGQVLMFHDETDGSTGLAAAEAFEDSL